ncbi:DHS-like NAD/FAD-binding domain-containing protein [Yarrowia lipolytica]|uniref:YALI0D16687p n=2 Tax=Yarrowia lipolytica TaxID=4952 RepID=Q6C8V5_YARLI|nr:YALI0D16687p [Yarrowia lipolytica CLIB122]RDW24657.1 DHS-like NAD/FAD-binding domain-containing protein [Yarrowia lipolytica]RDW30881.1 DHS-like NAD/FAD-binding domain-containing protein [Yarrowia lipolytica]RDW38854.1 DHS-like NAD/FAD-binding domain-containing protein [Yarrowia lipolytica]RDW44681.1 DHS-like NAD/FAD-binding domain-containing protein [Yarrowia lipolytica]RDW55069.1 DHS-like NAD/FAD-binding domain-containing protein [Yarrowia lipolytica]|eukprot:XP_502907.1 YALI0D16687p [Yarrowia lipolytica CLIB122]
MNIATLELVSSIMKLRIPKFENTPYTPTHTDVASAAKALSRFLTAKNTKTAILTGAGISTASGLPDYRGPTGTYTTNPNHQPTLYHEFVSDEHKRKRYWSRAWIGYEQALKWARPNVAHEVLTGWLRGGHISGLITQNVDGLHKLSQVSGGDIVDNVNVSADLRAGREVPALVELHGSAYRVHCLSCGDQTSREDFQDRMAKDNGWSKDDAVAGTAMTGRGFTTDKTTESDLAQFVDPGTRVETNTGATVTPGGSPTSSNPFLASLDDSTSKSRLDISGNKLNEAAPGRQQQLNADGDAELDVEIDYDRVAIPPCLNCGGVLKPSIVFFGESVPEADRARARDLLESSDQLLVIGTSLSTFSAFDLVRQFYKQGKKVAVLNKGGVRGEGKDWEADVRLDGDIGGVLEKVKM